MELVDNKLKQTVVQNLPFGWEIRKIGDIADVVGGGTPSTFINDYWNGQINWYTPTEVGFRKYSYESLRKISKKGLENCSAKILPIGTILLTSRAAIGDVSILMKEGCTNQGFQSLIVKNNTNNHYLYYLVSTLKNTLLQYASGSTFLEISPSKIKAIQITVPPLKEQTAIANALSDLDVLIENLEKLIAKKRNIKKGVMQELLKPKEGWVEKRVGELAEVKRGAGSQYIKYKEGTGIRFIRINDFFEDVPVYVEPTENILRFKIQENDILFAGTGNSAGACFLPKTDWIGLPHSYNAPRIRVNNQIDKVFLLYSLKSDYVLSQQMTMFVGAAQPFLDINAISNLNVPLPLKKEEQKQVASILSDIDSDIDELETRRGKYQMIKQGMMQALLTGKIRLL